MFLKIGDYMVSSGTVSSDLNVLTSSLSKYSSEMSGLSSFWQGQSYDSVLSKADSFISEYSGAISGQMDAFASACDLYEQYKVAKQNYQISINNYNRAASLNDTANLGTFQGDINRYAQQVTSLKSQIESNLAKASSIKLEATSNQASLSVGLSSASVAVAGNLIVSPSTGYVFPFAQGVSAPVTSSVGYRNQPTAGASTNHKGTDIGVPTGTEVHSLSGGVVMNAGRSDAGGYGNWVRVQQDDGNVVIYGHLSKSDFYRVGDRVNAGDLIALTGNEGVSTGPHLHLQIEDGNGKILNSEYIFQDCWPA